MAGLRNEIMTMFRAIMKEYWVKITWNLNITRGGEKQDFMQDCEYI